ncbi:MAG: peptide chain release factor N(5)-glutamine methyltransferase [Candidatus Paracaedibacteraceae bacterium]|nr:peptide chain release factor N(5)-glutamine methyltransferase [Candidatus Paracaedibacteraceae bacterium]
MDSYFKEWAQRLEAIGDKNVSSMRLINWLVQGLGIETDIRFLKLDSLNLKQKNQIETGLLRLLKREPISKVLNQKDFYGRTFKTTHDTLDPRSDSETLIRAMLEHFKQECELQFIDFGTGTGCLLITLLLELPYAKGVAVDLSAKALAVARENAEHHGVDGRIQFCESNWCHSVTGIYDGIISNPPYITSHYPLDPSVAHFDPEMALFGGEDGLDAYRALFSQLRPLCHANTKVVVEIGFDQSKFVPAIAQKNGFKLLSMHRDDGNIIRALTFQCE